MKELFNRFMYKENSSIYSTKVICVKEKKFKCTYRAINALEEFKIELFHDDQLNFICGIRDLGITPNSTAYIQFSEKAARDRINDLINNGVKFIESIM